MARNNISAFALPTVLVASMLIMLLVMSGYSALTMNLQSYAMYHAHKQHRLDLQSALVRLCRDSLFCPEGETVSAEIFPDHPVRITVRRWGLYETAALSAGNSSGIALIGRRHECPEQAAFWINDRDRPLSLAGDARIEGTAYIPAGGINYTEVQGDYYSGEMLPPERIRLASGTLPAIDSAYLRYAMEVFGADLHNFTDNDADDSRYRSFSSATAISYVKTVSGPYLGNIILTGDTVEITDFAEISDIIISARKVTVRSGFRGKMQVFCSDTVILEPGVRLEYPSGIYIDSDKTRPYAEIGEGSTVAGYIVVTGDTDDIQLSHPAYVQRPEARINGLLYIDGTCNIKGYISGAAYIRECFYRDSRNVYPRTLYNVRIERNDSIAYPILLSGEYRRMYIKNLH